MKKYSLMFVMIILGYLFFKNQEFLKTSAGVAMFLLGMLNLENGFKSFTGGMLENFLRKVTDKKYKSLSFGILTTVIMQSSTLVTVITISFLSAGLITLASGIGIILGANLGTTTGAWLIAGLGLKVQVSTLSMPMIVFGVLFLFQKEEKLQGLGQILTGLGFIFLGIFFIKEGFEAFKDIIDLSSFSVSGLKGLLIYTLVGIVATTIMQSSLATLVLIITALSVNQITYENALALAIGSNIGTTVTAIISSISANTDGKRLTVVHLFFNLIIGVIAIIFIKAFMFIVDQSAEVLGIAFDDYAMKLALFHTYFNLIGVILFYPLIDQIVILLNKYIVPSKIKYSKVDTAKYLTPHALEFTLSSKEVLFKECRHLYRNAKKIISYSISLKPSDINSRIKIDDVIESRNTIINKNIEELYMDIFKPIYSAIIDYAIKAQQNAKEEQSVQLMEIRRSVLYLAEAVKDAKHLQVNMLKYLMSDNENIRKEYNKIRKKLLKQLRLLDVVVNSTKEEEIVLFFGKLTLQSKKFDVISGFSVDRLLQEDKISNTIATSLMNDIAYASNIALKLTQMAKIIFISKVPERTIAREALLLEEEEVKDMVNAATRRQSEKG